MEKERHQLKELIRVYQRANPDLLRDEDDIFFVSVDVPLLMYTPAETIGMKLILQSREMFNSLKQAAFLCENIEIHAMIKNTIVSRAKLVISSVESFKLLYRGSRDGWTAKDFHRKCDNKGPTLCLFRSTKDYLCAGFTSVSWSSKTGDKEDYSARIFSLSN